MKNFLLGVAATLLVLWLGVYVSVEFGWVPANADAKPGKFERWMAHTSLDATIDREAPQGAVPIPLNDGNLLAGVKLYAMNCAVCHGTSDGMPSHIAIGLYQHAPQLARHGVEDDPEGETYWKIKHGIRLTGMPSYTNTLSEEQIWQLALFLKHMDSLPPKVNKAWKALPSQGR